ncbi:MAG: exodeoxyribonuclease VII large subunit [Eubacterium sp.]|nr:exodeoxyribonuclease VII large subunit [Eubacterium sp.]
MKVYSVGQINNYLKNLIQSDYLLRNFLVKGEISNCKYHSMGHIYFSLKDETGSMPCVMFKGNVSSGLKFELKNGQAVIVQGAVGVYEQGGMYQLYAKNIQLDGLGEGELHLKFEQLKERLYEEGLFDFEIKKPIPKFPKAVGIVTAKTGAAIQDIMNIARRRDPYVQLYLYPAKVQGEGAAETIVRGIKTLDKMGLDTIIVGRGGGSIEDLWAFNEEIVARAIFEAKTPIISGTGHEIDNTIADYVSDLRAPTPSAAAELAIPDVMSEIRKIEKLRSEIMRSFKARLDRYRLLNEKYIARLEKLSPEQKLVNNNLYLASLSDRMKGAMDRKYALYERRLSLDIARLNGLSPTAKLINGFGYISKGDEPLTSVKKVKEGEEIEITIHDGSLRARVTESRGQRDETICN